MLQQNMDYVICEKAGFMNSKSPTKITQGICVGTKDYLFFIPAVSMSNFVVFQTTTRHKFFEGVSIAEGTKGLINSCDSVAELESALTEMLENNDQSVHKIASYKEFVISGFFVKNNMRLINGRFEYRVCILKPKAVAKEFREFYGK